MAFLKGTSVRLGCESLAAGSLCDCLVVLTAQSAANAA